MMELKFDDEVFRVYALSIGVLIAKFLLMSFLTARQRFANLVFANPEDTVGSSKAKVNFANDNVERVRRAHQNDIENIVPFAILSGLYLAVANPSLFTAKCVFYGFTAARVLHTFVYLNQVPQPSRALTFMIGMIINFYMIFCIISGVW